MHAHSIKDLSDLPQLKIIETGKTNQQILSM